MKNMASRIFVTRKTLSRLEKGDPGVSLSVFASALWVLGFENDILEIVLLKRINQEFFWKSKGFLRG